MDLKSIEQNLRSMKGKFNFDPMEVEQKSEEWHFMRLGLVTASNFWKILPLKSGKYGQTRATYMNELVSQIADQEAKPNVSAKQMEWGNMHEPLAREKYAMILGLTIHEFPFVFSHNARAGLSPDGLTNEGLGFEIKCPWDSAHHTAFIRDAVIKNEYIHQVNSSMWMTQAEAWHFITYNPRCTVAGKDLFAHKFEPDHKLFGMYENELGQFLYEMDKVLMETYGITFDHKYDKEFKSE